MPYLLVPQEVSATTAVIWIGVIDEDFDPERFDPAQWVLRSDIGPHALHPQWQRWVSRNGAHRLAYQRVTLGNLQARRAYAVTLHVNGEPRASARVTTLPARLPTVDEKPFTVLLGSCFCRREDKAGTVGRTYSQIPAGARPEVKLLCGDQVYLDDPWHHYLAHTHTAEELEGEFFSNYHDTWAQQGGFQELLRDGANYFTSDDHELWNNAPNRASVIRDTWPIFDKRREWLDAARRLYQAFQTPAMTTSFSVGPLSCFLADTRMNRQSDRTTFMQDADLEAVGTWVNGLRGPGILVVGQPVLRGETNVLRGHFFDWGLPDYEQYGRLVRLLASSSHSIVILTGDVHYGRIARCALSSGNELIEVISSPMSLVDKAAEGTWEKAPAFFPAFDVSAAGAPTVIKAEIHTQEESRFAPTYRHFLTLEFSAAGARVVMAVKVWPVAREGGVPSSDFGKTVYQTTLQ